MSLKHDPVHNHENTIFQPGHLKHFFSDVKAIEFKGAGFEIKVSLATHIEFRFKKILF